MFLQPNSARLGRANPGNNRRRRLFLQCRTPGPPPGYRIRRNPARREETEAGCYLNQLYWIGKEILMNAMLIRLLPLVLELQSLPDWPTTRLPAGLMLYDVLAALGATQAEVVETLGPEVLNQIESPAVRDVEPTPSPGFC
jgi:hypothetical protein